MDGCRLRLVLLHHPIYSTTMNDGGSGEATGPVRSAYEPIFKETAKLRLVFSGHAHLYDRIYVPWDGSYTQTTTPPPHYSLGAGIHYIVTGGAGGTMNCSTPVPSDQPGIHYSQVCRCGNHFTKVTVTGSKIEVEAIGVNGSASSYQKTVWDRFPLD